MTAWTRLNIAQLALRKTLCKTFCKAMRKAILKTLRFRKAFSTWLCAEASCWMAARRPPQLHHTFEDTGINSIERKNMTPTCDP